MFIFLLRFTYVALLLILIQLLIPPFRPGGRYFILLAASAVALLIQLLRRIFTTRLLRKHQALLSGLSIVVVLFLARTFHSGVKLTFMGILVAYLGLTLLELLLPNGWYGLAINK